MNAKLIASLALTAVCAVTTAHAEEFQLNLFNTGVDATGAVLPNGTVGDLHYELVTVPGGTTDVRIVTSANGYPVGPWLGDNTSSRWISPNNPNNGVDSPQGTYVYRTTFDLTGLVPHMTRITGSWATDNNGLDILINGISTGATTNYLQFQAGMSPFSISSGFVAGINTIDFMVYNDFDVTGLRVELSGTGNDVPEPASLALVGLALAGVAASRRRRA